MEDPRQQRRPPPVDIPAFVEVLDALAAVAATQRPVLISARRGTAPLLLAQTIHHASARPKDLFVTVRCGLCPPSTIDLKLFGAHHPCAGKHKRLPGKIIEADGGTLFIEQVQSASPEAQRALLQIVEDHEFTAAGNTRKVDIRVIVSAPDSLASNVANGAFRADLFFRLNGMPIQLPPALATREALLGILAAERQILLTDPPPIRPPAPAAESLSPQYRHEAHRLTNAIRLALAAIGPDAPLDKLLLRTCLELGPYVPSAIAHQQLEAVVVRAASQCISNRAAFGPKIYDMLLVAVQRALIRRAIVECNGILDRAAALLGLSLHELETLIQKLGLTPLFLAQT